MALWGDEPLWLPSYDAQPERPSEMTAFDWAILVACVLFVAVLAAVNS